MNSTSKAIWQILGLFAGMLLAFVIGVNLLYQRADQNAQMQATSQSATAVSYSITLTALLPTPTATPILEVLYEETFYKAERALEEYDLDKAYEMLIPLTNEQLSDIDNARLYSDLGKIESNYGHSSMACNFFEKQYQYEQTPLVLMSMAQSCGGAGDLEKAMAYLQEIIDWPGSEADDYREYAQQILFAIQESLGLITPTPDVNINTSDS